MTLAGITAAELATARVDAEALMLDAGTARRPDGTAYDDEQQAEVTTYGDLFSSPCKLQARNVAALVEEVGGRTATTVRLELHLPVDTDPLTVGDVWEMTAVADLSSAVVGARYRVSAPIAKTYLTARRYEVEEVVS